MRLVGQLCLFRSYDATVRQTDRNIKLIKNSTVCKQSFIAIISTIYLNVLDYTKKTESSASLRTNRLRDQIETTYLANKMVTHHIYGRTNHCLTSILYYLVIAQRVHHQYFFLSSYHSLFDSAMITDGRTVKP